MCKRGQASERVSQKEWLGSVPVGGAGCVGENSSGSQLWRPEQRLSSCSSLSAWVGQLRLGQPS